MEPDNPESIKNPKIMFLMRGPPGSGKSTFAANYMNKMRLKAKLKKKMGDQYTNSAWKKYQKKHLAKFQEKMKSSTNKHILSTDDFFTHNGIYMFDVDKLAENHRNNQMMVETRMKQSMTPLFIDNTNIEAAHMWEYVRLAEKYEYHVRVVNMKNYVTKENPIWKDGKIQRELLYKRAQERRDSGSGKDIPNEVIDKMCDRYEQIPVLTLSDIYQAMEAIDDEKHAAVGDTVHGMDGTLWGTITQGPFWKLDNGTTIQSQNENVTWRVPNSDS